MSAETVINTSKVIRPVNFELVPDAKALGELASALDLRGLRKLRFKGTLVPSGAKDLTLDATLGATVVQSCVVTGDPVTTRIEERVLRSFVWGMEMPTEDEVEMPEDDTAEPMPPEIDLEAIMAEALSLALPPWPRADGVDPVNLTVSQPGVAPMTDEDVKPFAGLRALKDKMDNGESDA